MQKDIQRKHVKIDSKGKPKKPWLLPMASHRNKMLKNQQLSSANKLLKNKKTIFFKKHLHLIAAIASLVVIIISYHFWKIETQWVMKWMIIYTSFAIFYWSIKPVFRWIRERWNK